MSALDIFGHAQGPLNKNGKKIFAIPEFVLFHMILFIFRLNRFGQDRQLGCPFAQGKSQLIGLMHDKVERELCQLARQPVEAVIRELIWNNITLHSGRL
jgi:hypothetical protein